MASHTNLVGTHLTADHKVDAYIQAIKNTLPELVNKDPLFASRLFDVPSENYLGSRIDQIMNLN